MTPEFHVLAGPNGIGKTTGYDLIVPKHVSYINADLIAKEIKAKAGGLNVMDIANAEAARYFFERLAKRETFGFETNLCDLETYKSLQAAQALGYRIIIYFINTDDVDLCINRVLLRVQQGGHYVNPETVRSRYTTGLALLKYYKDFPDILMLIDNSAGELVWQAELHAGKIIYVAHPVNPGLRMSCNNKKPWTKLPLNQLKKSESPIKKERAFDQLQARALITDNLPLT